MRYPKTTLDSQPREASVSILLALLTPAAHAHASALLEGLDVQTHALGGRVVEASFGLLWRDEVDPDWRWICHEAVTQEGAVIALRYAFAADGTVLSAVPSLEQSRELGLPVYRSEDRCVWEAAAGLEGVPVIDLAAHPTDADAAIAIASDVAGGTGGSIERSVDGGHSFSTVRAADDRFYRTLAFGPDGRAWVAAAWYTTPGVWTLYSDDGGQTWTETAMPLPDVEPGTDVDADVLHADDTGAYVAVGAFRHDRLYRVDMGGAVTLLAEPDVELTDIDSGPDGTIWLAGNGDTFFRLDDEGLSTLDAAPVGQGVQVDDGVLRLATRSVLDGTQLVESTDRGETFTTSFHLSELHAPPPLPRGQPCRHPMRHAVARARGPPSPGRRGGAGRGRRPSRHRRCTPRHTRHDQARGPVPLRRRRGLLPPRPAAALAHAAAQVTRLSLLGSLGFGSLCPPAGRRPVRSGTPASGARLASSL